MLAKIQQSANMAGTLNVQEQLSILDQEIRARGAELRWCIALVGLAVVLSVATGYGLGQYVGMTNLNPIVSVVVGGLSVPAAANQAFALRRTIGGLGVLRAMYFGATESTDVSKLDALFYKMLEKQIQG